MCACAVMFVYIVTLKSEFAHYLNLMKNELKHYRKISLFLLFVWKNSSVSVPVLQSLSLIGSDGGVYATVGHVTH